MNRKTDYYIFLIIFYLLLFQDPIKKNIRLYGVVDEAITYMSLGILIIYIIKYKNISKNSFYILISSVVLVFVGLIGNLIYEYQLIKYAAKDIIIVFKSLIMYMAVRNCMGNLNLAKYKKSFMKQLKLMTIIIFILSIINIRLPIFPYYDYRCGIYSQQLFFSHPTYLANACILMNLIIYGISTNKRSEYIYMVMLTIVTIFTMRGKAIGFIAVFYLLIYILNIKKKNIKKSHIIIMIILLSLIGSSRLKEQIIENEEYPRSKLYRYSFEIAKDHFPIGSGFGTYGSYVSGEIYSPVYYKYNMGDTQGINPKDYGAVADTFWPMILGQFGLIGFIIYVSIIVYILKDINKYKKNNRLYYIGAISPIIYLLITSTSESSFANYYSVEFLFISGIFTNMLFKNENKLEIRGNKIEDIINK